MSLTTQRIWSLKTYYGLSPDEYEAMLRAQEGRCAICHQKGFNTFLVVDHDHETGLVRGLLCEPCNHMLGHAQENEETLLNAVGYLRAAKEEHEKQIQAGAITKKNNGPERYRPPRHGQKRM